MQKKTNNHVGDQRSGTSAKKDIGGREGKGEHRRCCFWKKTTRLDNTKQMSSNSRVERQGENTSDQPIYRRSHRSSRGIVGRADHPEQGVTALLSKNHSHGVGCRNATRNGQRQPSSFTDACVGAKRRFDQQGYLLEANVGQIYAFRKFIMGGFGKQIEYGGKTIKESGTTLIREIKDINGEYVYKRVKKCHRLSKREWVMWSELSKIPSLKRSIAPLLCQFIYNGAYHYIMHLYQLDFYYLLCQKPSIPVIMNVLLQVANAIVTLHQHDYVHLDIKPENVLIQGCRAILCDFATVHKMKLEDVRPIGMRIGTLEYCAPEAHKGMISKKSDVYSFCKTIHLSVYNHMPILQKMQPRHYGKWFDLFACCLQEDRKDRITSLTMYQKLYKLRYVDPYNFGYKPMSQGK